MSVPALGEDEEAPACTHGQTETREETGKAATCTEDGNHTVITVCAGCGAELSREKITDPAPGHVYKSKVTGPARTEAGKVVWTCTRCGDSFTEKGEAALGHDYIKTVTEPTCTEAGRATFTCSRCGDVYYEAGGAALGHDWQETARTEASEDAEGSVTYTCARCGDSRTEILPKKEKQERQDDGTGNGSGSETGEKPEGEAGDGTGNETEPVKPDDGSHQVRAGRHHHKGTGTIRRRRRGHTAAHRLLTKQRRTIAHRSEAYSAGCGLSLS